MRSIDCCAERATPQVSNLPPSTRGHPVHTQIGMSAHGSRHVSAICLGREPRFERCEGSGQSVDGVYEVKLDVQIRTHVASLHTPDCRALSTYPAHNLVHPALVVTRNRAHGVSLGPDGAYA